MPTLVTVRRAGLAAAFACLALLAATTTARAQWPATSAAGGLPVCTAPDYQWYQQAIEDGTGGFFLVWRDDRARTGGNPSNYDIYAQHVSAAGLPLWGVNGVAVCTDVAAQDRPSLCSDGAGGLFVAWSEPRFISSDIWAQRLNAAGVAQWALNGYRIARLDAANDYSPLLASDGAGGFWCVWSSYDPATGTRVRAQRVSAAGAPLWATAGVALSGATGNQSEPHVLDDSGALVASWVQQSNPRSVRAQRLNGAGTALWGGNGLAVSDTTRAASYTHYVVPGLAGARFLVHDTAIVPAPWFRDVDAAGATLRFAAALPGASWPEIVTSACAGDSGTTLLASTNGAWESAQRLAADGTLDWGPHGRPVSPDTLTRTKFTVIARDGGGGAYLLGIAVDTTSYLYEVRAQHVRWNTSLAWLEEGLTLAEAVTGDQQQPLAVATEHGVIGVWQDYRTVGTSGLDLYAQRVDSTGVLGIPVLDAPLAVDAGARFAAPWPNPARGAARVTLRFALPAAGRATLALHDVAGRRVTTLADGAFAAGPHEVAADAAALAPGLYFARLRAGGLELTRRLVVIR
ncbi:MAG: hypothetical protein U0704_15160 [Candidatus Eisenbacteria bacterium]